MRHFKITDQILALQEQDNDSHIKARTKSN